MNMNQNQQITDRKMSEIKKEAENVWEKLSMANNFVFMKMMQNSELCRKVLSEIVGMEISKVEYPEYEKTIDVRYDAKSIRLDVYVKDVENTVYNVEIQNVNVDNIPKRGRYYQDLIDLDLLEKGCYYEELNKSIVIFICTFDLYGKNKYMYTFTNRCREIPNLEYGDETLKIIVNTYGTEGEASEDLKDFLKSINGQFTSSEFSDKLKREFDRVKRSEECRREFMTLYLHEEEVRRNSYYKGMIEQTIKFYEKGKITEDEAVEELGISVEEFRNAIQEYKNHI